MDLALFDVIFHNSRQKSCRCGGYTPVRGYTITCELLICKVELYQNILTKTLKNDASIQNSQRVDN